MKYMLLCTCIFSTCSAPLSAAFNSKELHQMKKHMEEVRINIIDLQQITRQHDLALSIIEEERAEKKNGGSFTDASLQERVANLEKKLQQFTQQFAAMEELVKTELHELSSFIERAPSTKEKYVVKSGDTLDKIARTHHTTVDSLLQKNHLTSTTIFVGQELLIPSP